MKILAELLAARILLNLLATSTQLSFTTNTRWGHQHHSNLT